MSKKHASIAVFAGNIVLASWAFTAQEAAAKSPNPPLVLVTDARDHESVSRIGERIVQVQLLFSATPRARSYEASNDRVQGLIEYQILLFREDTESSACRFWRARITAANPRGYTHRLPEPRQKAEVEREAERLRAIHRALVSRMPDREAQLDANLQSELGRLVRRSKPALRLAAKP